MSDDGSVKGEAWYEAAAYYADTYEAGAGDGSEAVPEAVETSGKDVGRDPHVYGLYLTAEE